MASQPPVPIWHRFVAGTASGVALVLVGHPLDTLKVKMQLATGASPPSLGAVLRTVLASEGLRGFYRGFLPPLLFTGGINTVLWGLQFSFTDALERSGNGGGAASRAMLAAIPSGLLVSVIVTPIEGIKTRMQAAAAVAARTNGGSPATEGTFQVISRVLREGGLRRGLFRGWSATALARMSNWAYFGGYAAATEALEGPPGSAPSSGWAKTRTSLAAGGVAGLCYWAAAFPFDTLKARMMLTEHASLRSTAAALYADAGLGGFWRGFTPCALRAFPANAAAFTGFSLAMDALQRRPDSG